MDFLGDFFVRPGILFRVMYEAHIPVFAKYLLYLKPNLSVIPFTESPNGLIFEFVVQGLYLLTLFSLAQFMWISFRE